MIRMQTGHSRGQWIAAPTTEEKASKQIFGKLGHLQEQLVALGIRWTPGRVNVLKA